MNKAFGITALALGAAAFVASIVAIVFGSIALKKDDRHLY